MSAASLKQRAVQRRVLIAAGIWAVIPAAVVAVLIFIRLLASARVLPESAPALAVLTVMLAAIVWLLIPFRKPLLVPRHYFERFQVSEAERQVGLGALIVTFAMLYVLWHSRLFGLLG